MSDTSKKTVVLAHKAEAARILAERLHTGQVDRQGKPYIL